jgi:hypothetical protein
VGTALRLIKGNLAVMGLTTLFMDDTFRREVRDALNHIHDPIYLQTHPLARMVPPGSLARGQALRSSLLAAARSLATPGDSPRTAVSHDDADIVNLRYVEGLDPTVVQRRLHLSRSVYYRRQQQAIEAVASVLWERWHQGSD